MKHLLLSHFAILVSTTLLLAQSDDTTKTGVKVYPLPAISFDSDLGLQYGALTEWYFFGDGSQGKDYRHKLYFEWSRYTKGSGINRFFYDSKYLIPKVRVTLDLSYLTEQALQFYGFNGYGAVYNADWVDDTQAEGIYRSRMFYRHERKRFRLNFDLQGKLKFDNLKWDVGLALFNDKISSVDIDNLNEGKDDDDKLPSLTEMPGLYERYLAWGIIPKDEASGGSTNYLKLGLVFDTRDNEVHPFKGMWTEAILVTAPDFLGNDFAHTKLKLTHRQYFTVIENRLSFAYRLAYQGTMGGHAPWFMQPNIATPYLRSANSEGLGGSKTLRGILRNRVVGNGIALGNMEFRWKFVRFTVLKQSCHLALNPFLDMGMVVDEMDIETDEVNFDGDVFDDYFETDKDQLHLSAGLGLKIVLNNDFVISVDYGLAIDEQDGTSGVYVGLNYLF